MPESLVRPPPEGEVATRLSLAADLVSRLAGASRDVVHPVLCRSGDEEVGGLADDVLVCSRVTLLRTLTDRPSVLSPSRVAATSLRLEARLRTSTGALAPPHGAPDAAAAAGDGPAVRPPAVRPRAVRPASPARVVAQVLVALLLFAALLVAGAQVADRMDVLPTPSQDTGPAVR